jgi:hypothetical protein
VIHLTLIFFKGGQMAEEDIQVANTDTGSTVLPILEVQIKTAVRFHSTRVTAG